MRTWEGAEPHFSPRPCTHYLKPILFRSIPAPPGTIMLLRLKAEQCSDVWGWSMHPKSSLHSTPVCVRESVRVCVCVRGGDMITSKYAGSCEQAKKALGTHVCVRIHTDGSHGQKKHYSVAAPAPYHKGFNTVPSSEVRTVTTRLAPWTLSQYRFS